LLIEIKIIARAVDISVDRNIVKGGWKKKKKLRSSERRTRGEIYLGELEKRRFGGDLPLRKKGLTSARQGKR